MKKLYIISSKVLTIIVLIFSTWANIQSQYIDENDEYVKASIIITSIGALPHQITGHAAIRMQCDSLGLDRVFTFDNNVGDDLKKFYLDGGRGKIFENTYQDYIEYIRDEGRELNAYYLNLTLNEKIRLWEVLDSVKLLPERQFDICESHCFSVISSTIDEAIFPKRINWDLASLTWKSYSEIAKSSGGESNQWNYLLIMLALGSKADEGSNGNEFIYPTAFADVHDIFFIINENGTESPLVDRQERLIKSTTENKPIRPSPTVAGLIFIILTLGITIIQYFSQIKWLGITIDLFILATTIICGVLIILVTYLPNHYGGNWNWPLLILNPFAFIPILIFQKNRQLLRLIWAVYAVILILFAVFISFIAPSVSIFWRLIAIGITIRCVWHTYNVKIFS